jgi:uncharacterized protein YrrD
MRKGSDVINKVVVTYDTGERVARIQDLIFDQDSNQLLGFLVSEAGWFRGAEVIPFRQVQAIGASAIVIPSKGAIVRAAKVPEIRAILKRNNVLRGTRIMTVSGRDLGTMIDLYFNDQTGIVEGYEVSGGLFADAYSGRSFVPAPQTLRIGEHVAFVPIETADLMEEQVGGIRGVMQTASGKLQATTETAGQQLQAMTQTANEKLQETAELANRRIQAASRAATFSLTSTVIDPTQQKAFVIGKVAEQDVVLPSGMLLVASGQAVSLETAELAEQEGMLNQLYRATGGDLSAELSGRLQATTDSTNRRLQEILSVVSNRLQETTGVANERLQEITRSAAASLTNAIVDPAEQKALVLNKVIDQDVITSEGIAIAIRGQVVTAAMIEQAEQCGVLDQLFRAAGGSLTSELSRAVNTIIATRMIEQAIGRRVHHTVRTEDGLIVAASGQIVTEQVLERARAHQQEPALLDAVGLTPSEAIRSSAGTTLAESGEQWRDRAILAKEQADNLMELAKERLAELQAQTKQAIEEYRIKRALGRPATRVILDQQDSVILNIGELITHQAIERARDAGVLDILLSSVYTKQPELAATELHLPVKEVVLQGRSTSTSGV